MENYIYGLIGFALGVLWFIVGLIIGTKIERKHCDDMMEVLTVYAGSLLDCAKELHDMFKEDYRKNDSRFGFRPYSSYARYFEANHHEEDDESKEESA